MSEERMHKLRTQLEMSMDIASHSQNPQQGHLSTIKQIWKDEEKLLFDPTSGSQPTMQEMLLDLQVIDNTGGYVTNYIRNLHANTSSFSATEYAEELIKSLTENALIDWDKLTEGALPIINQAPGIDVMLGAFKSTPELTLALQRKKPTARIKDKIVEKQTSETVTNIERDNESVDIKVNHVMASLKQHFKRNGNHPIEFYKFVLHPTDFTTTVENIFCISFIIRDGLASLDLIEDEFVISPAQKESCASNKELKELKNQMVFSITMSQWQDLVTSYGITSPAIVWSN